jgi:hypothetical protein
LWPLTVKEARKARRGAGDLAERQIAAMAAQVQLMNEANVASLRQHKIELDYRHVVELRQLAELLARASDAAAEASRASPMERPSLSLSELLLSIQIAVAALSASGYNCPDKVIDVVSFSGQQGVDPAVIDVACTLARFDISAAFANAGDRPCQRDKAPRGLDRANAAPMNDLDRRRVDSPARS